MSRLVDFDPPVEIPCLMNCFHASTAEPFIPILPWTGRRPSLADLSSWHEALSDSIAVLLPFDLMACWLYPTRGGSVLIGPVQLAQDRLVLPGAEPLVGQEEIFRVEDRIRLAGYQSVLAVPIRDDTQDVGLLLVAGFTGQLYDFDSQRTLYRIASEMMPTCRRLAAHLWLSLPGRDDDTESRSAITDRILDATNRARDGADLVQLASDALAPFLAHDRLDLIAVAPAPECWALLAPQHVRVQLTPRTESDRIERIVAACADNDLVRISDTPAQGLIWPAAGDQRGADRLRSLLAVRLEVGGAVIGWLWLGSETPGWFRNEDEEIARHAARLIGPSVAGWMARTEQAGVWE